MNKLDFVRSAVEDVKSTVFDANKKIWSYAELSHHEVKSSALLVSLLKAEGFTVEEGYAGCPTAFIARFGDGHPVMGLLGEYDALPKLSQQAAVAEQKPEETDKPGHGCGHSLLGTASLAAAFAVKRYLQETGKPGTIIYYGCAAEENCGVKPLMARDGAFEDVDGVFAWHPASYNGVTADPTIAIVDARFEFKGVTAHAGGAPHLGRSALDACELMNVGVNYLREHVTSDVRMHYAYLDCGGTAPNVVQDHATLMYCVRAAKLDSVFKVLERVTDCAKGAALMTGTEMKRFMVMGYSDSWQNPPMAEILDEALTEVGAPKWSEEDYALARAYTAAYTPAQAENMKAQICAEHPAKEFETKIREPLSTALRHFDPTVAGLTTASTDVGDVCYVTPTATLNVATQTMGCPGHSWYVTGMSNSGIGEKGLICAAETMALACLKAMDRPEVLKAARDYMNEYTGGKYVCPMGNVMGPFDV